MGAHLFEMIGCVVVLAPIVKLVLFGTDACWDGSLRVGLTNYLHPTSK